MVLKLPYKLIASKLKTELKRVGIKWKFVKALAIEVLSANLMDISEDPVTFQFDAEVPIKEVTGRDNDDEYTIQWRTRWHHFISSIFQLWIS